jgi:hypothetical protein
MNAFGKIAEGLSSIAGPLSVGAKTLLAVDGQLSELTNGSATPLTESAYVLCLEESAGLAYACKPDGIARVSDQGLGAALFKLAWLVAPNLSQLAPGKPHDRCDYQWQDMRFDLIALGTPLPEEATPDGGTGPVGAEPEPADAATPDAYAPEAGAESARDAGLALDAGDERRPHDGCALSPRAGAPGAAWFVFGLAVLAVRRVRGRASR